MEREAISHTVTKDRLQYAKELIETVFDNISDSISVIDPADFKIVAANKAFLNTLNMTEEAVIGKRCYEVTHHRSEPCKPPDDICPLLETLKTGHRALAEHIHYDHANNKIYVEISTSAIRDRKGEIYQVIHIARDITARKRAEEALRDGEQRYRTLTENSCDLITEISADGRALYVSPNHKEVLGYEPEELMGKEVFDNVHPEDLSAVMAVFGKAIESFSPAMMVFRYRHKNGSWRWLDSRGAPYRTSTGEIRGVLSCRDITEQRWAQEELQNSFETLRKALSGTIDAMALTVETRDPYTAGHQKRVADLARAIADEMKLSSYQIDGLRMAGSIHDLGKLAVPVEILSKPGRITEMEFNLIKTHAKAGYDILKEIDFPWPVAQIVFQHHERMDGSGYPSGLSGEDILMEARILAVADVVEAIASNRPYRAALGIDKALEELVKNRGIFYDPDVVDACLRVFLERKFKFKV